MDSVQEGLGSVNRILGLRSSEDHLGIVVGVYAEIMERHYFSVEVLFHQTRSYEMQAEHGYDASIGVCSDFNGLQCRGGGVEYRIVRPRD